MAEPGFECSTLTPNACARYYKHHLPADFGELGWAWLPASRSTGPAQMEVLSRLLPGLTCPLPVCPLQKTDHSPWTKTLKHVGCGGQALAGPPGLHEGSCGWWGLHVNSLVKRLHAGMVFICTS